ncbi:hypothetical protein LP420_36125 [Massilia sp. B-10]|nr:hypothetical protein LP420_36125 [Massilia sp. B-10]
MVFKSVPFLVMLLFAVLNLIGSSIDMSSMFGTTVYPVTHLMLDLISGTFNFMLVLILMFYAGELIFKERQVKVADVSDAMPVPDWAPMLAKIVALAGCAVWLPGARLAHRDRDPADQGRRTDRAPAAPERHAGQRALFRADGTVRGGAAGTVQQQVHRLPADRAGDGVADGDGDAALRP